MMLSKRLRCVADLVGETETMADIGTDHGYVPISLYLAGKIKHGIALDIREGPLKKAQENIALFHASSGVTTRLGGGLIPLKLGEVQTAVIAGMGGMLIIDILKESAEKVLKLDTLVLQPQLDADRVRKYVHSIGFRIEEEKLVFEDGNFYPLFRAHPGLEKYEKEEQYLFGKLLIEHKDSELKHFLLHSIKKQEALIYNLSKTDTPAVFLRKQELEIQHQVYKEVLKCFL